jgi:ACR3 family arsenite efflux pump ArsB
MSMRVVEGTWHRGLGSAGADGAAGGDLGDPVTIGLIGAMLGVLAVALVDIKRRPADQIRGPKQLWTTLSLINWVIGPVAYFIFGRRRRHS